MLGLVISGSNNFFTVRCGDGGIRRCNIKGKVLKQEEQFYNALAPGDYVIVEPDILDNSEGRIISLQDRKNFFARKNEKNNSPQILASNIDTVLCLTTPDRPEFRPIFVDRVLVQAASQNISVIIVLNKIDLGISPEVKKRIDNWRELGYKVREISALNGIGIQELSEEINNKTLCVIGQSGVGKSTLLNTLCPDLNLQTAEISAKQNRGSHTTTMSALYRIKNAATDFSVIDTPGVKNFSLYNIPKEEVALYFPEMRDALGKCKFGLSCSHKTKKGCAILQLLSEGKILKERYDSWLNMT